MMTHESFPDAAVFAVCEAAKGATAAIMAGVEKPDGVSALISHEADLFASAAATRANTADGIAAKAALLAHYRKATDACEPDSVAKSLAFAIVDDSLGLLRQWLAPAGRGG